MLLISAKIRLYGVVVNLGDFDECHLSEVADARFLLPRVRIPVRPSFFLNLFHFLATMNAEKRGERPHQIWSKIDQEMAELW